LRHPLKSAASSPSLPGRSNRSRCFSGTQVADRFPSDVALGGKPSLATGSNVACVALPSAQYGNPSAAPSRASSALAYDEFQRGRCAALPQTRPSRARQGLGTDRETVSPFWRAACGGARRSAGLTLSSGRSVALPHPPRSQEHSRRPPLRARTDARHGRR